MNSKTSNFINRSRLALALAMVLVVGVAIGNAEDTP